MSQMMKTPRPLAWTAIMALPLLISGCAASQSANPPAKSGPPTMVLPSAQDIGFGQRAYADGPIIEAVKLLEDSRCPQNARCVWAGRLKLQMIWHRGNGEAFPFELTLGTPTHIADGQIQITAATPPSLAGEPALQPQDYRFSFRFDGGY